VRAAMSNRKRLSAAMIGSRKSCRRDLNRTGGAAEATPAQADKACRFPGGSLIGPQMAEIFP